MKNAGSSNGSDVNEGEAELEEGAHHRIVDRIKLPARHAGRHLASDGRNLVRTHLVRALKKRGGARASSEEGGGVQWISRRHRKHPERTRGLIDPDNVPGEGEVRGLYKGFSPVYFKHVGTMGLELGSFGIFSIFCIFCTCITSSGVCAPAWALYYGRGDTVTPPLFSPEDPFRRSNLPPLMVCFFH